MHTQYASNLLMLNGNILNLSSFNKPKFAEIQFSHLNKLTYRKLRPNQPFKSNILKKIMWL